MRMAWLLGLLFIASPIVSAQSAPVAVVDEETFHFTPVEQGAPLVHTFVVRNTGTAPLRILALELSPGLRLGRMPAHVAPGGHVDVRVVVETAWISGEFEGYIGLRVNDPDRPMITLTLIGTVVMPVEFKPFAAFFASGQRGTGGQDTIELVTHENVPLRLVGVDAPTDRFSIQWHALEPERRYRVTLTLHPDAVAGERQDVVFLRADDGRRFRVVANTRVRERVYAFPDAVNFGSDEVSLSQTLMVYQAGGSGFQATFSTDVPGMSIAAEPGPRGDRWQATLTLPPHALVTPLVGSVVIQTNDPEFPRLIVPVSRGPVPAPR